MREAEIDIGGPPPQGDGLGSAMAHDDVLRLVEFASAKLGDLAGAAPMMDLLVRACRDEPADREALAFAVRAVGWAAEGVASRFRLAAADLDGLA